MRLIRRDGFSARQAREILQAAREDDAEDAQRARERLLEQARQARGQERPR